MTQPEPVLHGRLPADRDAAPARGRLAQGAARRARSSCCAQVEIPDAERRLDAYPAPALRRHEPARDDRDGDRLQPEPADRRRADHRARRHHPGADPGPAAGAAARARHGAGADHPRPRRRRRSGAARARDVCRPGGRDGSGAATSSRRRATRTPRRCWRRCPSTTSASAACATMPGMVPGAVRPAAPAACSSPRCPYVQPTLPRRAAGAVPTLGAGARRAATFRCMPRTACRHGRHERSVPLATRDRRDRRAAAQRRCSRPRAAAPSTTRSRAASCKPQATRARARRRVVRAARRAHARGRRRIGLRQEHARAPGHDDRDADRRRAALDGADVATPTRDARKRPAPARCRWCSRTRTRASIRARRSARCSRSRCAINTTLTRRRARRTRRAR